MEFITVAYFAEVEVPERYSPSFFKHRGKNEWNNASTPTLYSSVYRDNLNLRGKYDRRSSYYWKAQSTA
jgi:hypothetical protein